MLWTMKAWGGRDPKVSLTPHHSFETKAPSRLNIPYLVCCIYHAPHAVGESSSESDSSDSDSDSSDQSSGNDDGAARMAGRNGKDSRQKRKANRDSNEHGHDGCNGHEHDDTAKGDTASKKTSRNAYEKMPKRRGGSKATVEVKK